MGRHTRAGALKRADPKKTVSESAQNVSKLVSFCCEPKIAAKVAMGWRIQARVPEQSLALSASGLLIANPLGVTVSSKIPGYPVLRSLFPHNVGR